MDLNLTEDQRLIRESAARLVADAGRPHHDARGFDRKFWNQAAEMGWIAAGIPDELGGFGGANETAIIVEELGRGARGSDFMGAGILGPQLLIASRDRGAIDDLLPAIIEGRSILASAFSERHAGGSLAAVATSARLSGDGYRLTGEKTLVLCGDIADHYIVSARTTGATSDRDGISLFLVEAGAIGLDVAATPLVDGSASATLTFDNTPATLIGSSGAGYTALSLMAERGIAAIAAESVGIMEAVTEITAEYFRCRKQFGVPLGQFQILQHKLSDMTIDAEMGRATLLVALAAFQIDEAASRSLRFSGAKAAAGEALRRVTEAGVQAHGGMGMTQEYPVGRYLQRMVVLDAILGSPASHLARCAAILSTLRG